MTTDEKYMSDEAALRSLIRRLDALLQNMQTIGETEMGNLTYAEAALFHGATDLIEQLLASIHDRRARA